MARRSGAVRRSAALFVENAGDDGVGYAVQAPAAAPACARPYDEERASGPTHISTLNAPAGPRLEKFPKIGAIEAFERCSL